jgi:trimeric autotransporter adhesin
MPLASIAGTGFPRLLALVLVIAGLGAGVPVAHGQCTEGWLPGSGMPGVNLRIRTMINWDPDGPGPAAPVIAAGGEFAVAGGQLVFHVAYWDGHHWKPLGSGMNNHVYALAAMPDGDLIAGGLFTYADGAPAARIARWNGVRWAPMFNDPSTPGFNGLVHTMAVLPDGSLVVGGSFSALGNGSPGTVWVNNLARWGPAPGGWSGLGDPNAEVRALKVTLAGDLLVGGAFTSVGGTPARFVARWDGSNFSPVGALIGPGGSGNVLALESTPNGGVYAGGFFTLSSGAAGNHVAYFDGSTWSPLGAGTDASVTTLTRMPSGDLFAGGFFNTAGGVSALRVARWDGSSWSSMNSYAVGLVYTSVLLPGGDLACNMHLAEDANNTEGIARWDGGEWTLLHPGTSGPIHALAVYPDGRIVAGGSFFFGNSRRLNHVAVDSGGGLGWRAFGAGLSSGTNGPVREMCVRINGDLIVGGAFSTAGGGPAQMVARWDGSAWHAIADYPFSEMPESMLAMPNGDVLVGAYSVRRWNGAAWSTLGAGTNGFVNALALAPGGDVYAGGDFSTAGGISAASLARWDGAAWWPLGDGTDGVVHAVALLPGGRVVAAGQFTTAGGGPANNIAIWNGATWSALADGLDGRVGALAVLPSGDLVAGGDFTASGTTALNYIARWDGAAWRAMGLGAEESPYGNVQTLVVTPDGDLVVGGGFFQLDGEGRMFFARWHTCPACGSSDFNGDGDFGTDQDIEAFFACLAGFCCPACGSSDFNHDGDFGTDADIEAFFRVIAGAPC